VSPKAVHVLPSVRRYRGQKWAGGQAGQWWQVAAEAAGIGVVGEVCGVGKVVVAGAADAYAAICAHAGRRERTEPALLPRAVAMLASPRYAQCQCGGRYVT